MQQLVPTALAQWLADASRAQPVLLDVRETGEVQICALPGITHIPMARFRIVQPSWMPSRTSSVSATTVAAACRWRSS